MKVNASITDFPVFSQLETFFKKFKEADVDGLEMVLGIKSRFEFARINYLSEKYNLSIASIHQPPWSGLGLFFDESFVEMAKKLGTRSIVFHPLTFCSFESRAMKRYLQRLAKLQEKHNIVVMLENMPKDYAYSKLHDSSSDHIEHHLERLSDVIDTYGFLMTYDVSHAEVVKPQDTKIFNKLFPKIGNIHVSSFTHGHHHLPLGAGIFDTDGFVDFLEKKKYKGLMTLEVNDPTQNLLKNKYNFRAISQSVALLKKKHDK